MRAPRLGDQELQLVRWLAENGPASVSAAVTGFGEPRGLARSTVLTMMERLRAKRFLERKRADGVYLYAVRESSERLMDDLVRQFVEGRLAGSVSPVVNYLVERAEVSEAELGQLEGLVARLQSKRGNRRRREK